MQYTLFPKIPQNTLSTCPNALNAYRNRAFLWTGRLILPVHLPVRLSNRSTPLPFRRRKDGRAVRRQNSNTPPQEAQDTQAAVWGAKAVPASGGPIVVHPATAGVWASPGRG
jgi:hypothetical protein